MPYICLCAHYVHSWACDITSRRSWKGTYTHVHCLCDCVTQRRGIFSLVRLLDTGTRPLTLLGCFELLLLYFPRCLFTHSSVQLGNMCKARQLHIFKLYCAKNPTHPDLAALYFCHLGFVFVSFFLCHLSFVFVKILLYVSKLPLASTIHHSWMKKATLKISQLKTSIDWDVEMNAERDKETHIEG